MHSNSGTGAVAPLTPKATTIIVDDDRVMRRFVRQALRAVAEIEVVGEAGNGIDAIRIIKALHPRVVVLDIDMPELDGIAVAEEIATSGIPSRIVFFTGHPVADVHARASRIGSYQVVRKHAAHELLPAVIAAAK